MIKRLIFLILVSIAISYPSDVLPQERRLNFGDIKWLIENKSPDETDETIVSQIKEYGINFKLTPKHVEELKALKPSNALIQAIEQASDKYIIKKYKEKLGELCVESEPSGVEVFVDGEPRGETPVCIKELTPGAKEVLLKGESKRYKDYKSIVMIETSTVKRIEVSLEPLFLSITVKTIPPAAVYIDGEYKDYSPLTIKNLKPGGEYIIKIEKEGYKTVEKKIILAEVSREIEIPLEPLSLSITVKTTPSADVYIDGEYKGFSYDYSPLTIKNLKPGEYIIKIEKQGYKPVKKKIILTEVSREIEITLMEKVEPPTRIYGYTFLALGLGFGYGSYYFDQKANDAYDQYMKDVDVDDMDEHYKEYEDNYLYRNISMGGAAVSVLISAYYFWFKESPKDHSPLISRCHKYGISFGLENDFQRGEICFKISKSF